MFKRVLNTLLFQYILKSDAGITLFNFTVEKMKVVTIKWPAGFPSTAFLSNIDRFESINFHHCILFLIIENLVKLKTAGALYPGV